MKIIKKIILTFTTFLACLLLFSPFQKNEDVYSLEKTIIIQKPASDVYTYLGNSQNASRWSVFINHITPLNTHVQKDGYKGSIRRCYKNEDEQGIWWDEEILIAKHGEERELTIYNLHGFFMQTHNLTTKQKYTNLGDTATQLTFGLYKNAEEVGVSDWFKIRTAGWVISNIFRKNLKGIKRESENL